MIARRPLLGALAALPLAARAEEPWPSRPIRLLVPYAAGGGTDAVARTFAARLSAALGQPVVVENKPGAGGNIATEAAATAKPDGYTLLVGNQGPMAANPSLFRRLPADPAKTLDPVGLIADAPLLVVAGPGSKAQDLKALIEEARAAGGSLTYGSASNGSASHLAAALLCQMAGVDATHVPYRGAAPALTEVVAGNLAFMITTLPSVMGLTQGGQLRALAVTGPERAAVLPGVPAVAETLPGYRATAWYGLMAPKGTPPEVMAKLWEAMRVSLGSEDVVERLRGDGAEPGRMDGPAFGRFIAEERERWARVIRAANI
ncbi:MAG TPA: tripartite tricarboxylate transporter substrate binding protein, partial [Crenalkalicoccus sp.]|nr:tripartite tricarboxylate transporter substrate binding protein [Crenalkalicoccus sp.]